MPIGKTPQNQLDALPLQDADSAANGGVLQVVGGSVVRFWTPATLALNNVSAFVVGAFFGFFTPYLQLTGCSKFALSVRRDTTTAGATSGCSVGAQYRLGPTDVPPDGPVTGANNYILPSTSLIFPSNGGVGTNRQLYTFDEITPGGNAGQLAVAIGTDVRFLFYFSADPGLGAAGTSLFSVYIWGAT